MLSILVDPPTITILKKRGRGPTHHNNPEKEEEIRCQAVTESQPLPIPSSCTGQAAVVQTGGVDHCVG
jgi:hypothetical protein